MFILHKNFTKWAAGCTKTFGEGVGVGRGVAVQEGNTDSGQERSGGRVGAQAWPRPSLHAHACTLLACRQGRGLLGGEHGSDLRSPEPVGRREVPPPWLNTASETSNTHVVGMGGGQ
ncbi:unnamed protein product [Rangifer tarandus platyrhynchus]|uniref:Uncharacterized protein n=2 Tax=Rangifer tarandus platyrhynchus TaxID=3082113 RepID=A0ABN8ZGV3_RANTA|nr:unnamed protein product [Rangifer tarandus platyrhynchus]